MNQLGCRFFVYLLVIYVQFVSILFPFLFFRLIFIASEWVSHQSCSLPSQQIKAKTAYHFLSLTRCLLVASINYKSVLLDLFFPLTHFNTYQLQVLVLPKILRMQSFLAPKPQSFALQLVIKIVYNTT